jgi:hypothetical protein
LYDDVKEDNIDSFHSRFFDNMDCIRIRRADNYLESSMTPTFGESSIVTLASTSNTKETEQQQSQLQPQQHQPPPRRHDVPTAQMTLTPEEQQRMEANNMHQQNAPKLGFAADVRSLNSLWICRAIYSFEIRSILSRWFHRRIYRG